MRSWWTKRIAGGLLALATASGCAKQIFSEPGDVERMLNANIPRRRCKRGAAIGAQHRVLRQERFEGISTRYLENYLGWFRVLDRSPGFAPEPASLLALAVRV